MQLVSNTSRVRVSALGAGLREMSVVNLLGLITAAYISLGIIYLIALGDNPIEVFQSFVFAFPQFIALAMLLVPAWALVLLCVGFVWLCRIRNMDLGKLREVMVAIVYCTVFTFMFSLVKNKLPLVNSFWADPMFTELDKMLHFGMNPRDFLEWLSFASTRNLSTFYFNGWVFFATYLPVLLVAFDTNKQRARTFTLLWAACWVVLGNFIAVVFMSAGPIFAGLLPSISPSDHAAVMGMLARDDASMLHSVRDVLWHAYAEDQSQAASGISAFPSVHVGMATVVGLYILRLGRDLQTVLPATPLRHVVRVTSCLASVVIVGVFMVLSVYLGWHYAVDGYASIMVMTGLYWMMQRRVQRDSAFFGQAYAA
ncbi:phosphatase PAP2 family protein [Celeribacter sp.]|uniref:phosphatase PAP2 family protein n=1 Tax=Celeribacter sp. TaxID=1890673 RepID=UPI003A8EE9D7